jgi:hypothetical protein
MTDTAHPAQVLLCRRNAEGRIVALTRQLLSAQEAQAGGWEVVAAAEAEVEVFLHEVSTQANPLSQTDTDLARVLEDLIDVLINRGLIQFTDLPKAAQAKLLERRQTRAQYAHRLELLPDDSDAGLF